MASNVITVLIILGFNLLIFPLSVGLASKIYKKSHLGVCVKVWPSRSEHLCGSCPMLSCIGLDVDMGSSKPVPDP